MTDWQITTALIMGGIAVGLLYNISMKVEAMCRLMGERAAREDYDRISH